MGWLECIFIHFLNWPIEVVLTPGIRPIVLSMKILWCTRAPPSRQSFHSNVHLPAPPDCQKLCSAPQSLNFHFLLCHLSS